ncbi:14758_t:CDS:1, partial [Acaulospora morrowiae]
ETPIIKLPWPPSITASDFLSRRKPSQSLRSPNAFLVYRKAFLDQLSRSNHNLKMTDVSKLVSIYWKKESKCVKDAYKEIAQEVEKELIENRKKDLSTIRVVWKNSKLSSRKRKQNIKCSSNNPLGITIDGDHISSIKNSSILNPRDDIGQYEFVSVCPGLIHSSPSEETSDWNSLESENKDSSTETTPVIGTSNEIFLYDSDTNNFMPDERYINCVPYSPIDFANNSNIPENHYPEHFFQHDFNQLHFRDYFQPTDINEDCGRIDFYLQSFFE